MRKIVRRWIKNEEKEVEEFKDIKEEKQQEGEMGDEEMKIS